MTEPEVANIIAANRLAKAKKIAAYLTAEFLRIAEHCTPEERQNIAVKSGVNADKPPSDESWAIVMSILRGAKL